MMALVKESQRNLRECKMSMILRQLPREIKFTCGINPYAAGSVIAEFGNTKVHITAVIEEGVPPWMKGQGRGWLTAEYSMLPSATHTRSQRERSKISGRTQEIQRLIGRSLRAVVDLEKLGERTLMIDCDVLVADGGTRTTSISGAYVAVALAVESLKKAGKISLSPLIEQMGAISVGINDKGEILSDLNYEEDSDCSTDMNIVMTASGKYIEVQGTAEKNPYSKEELTMLLDCAQASLKVVFEKQNAALK
jgi:ribonuclease PH